MIDSPMQTPQILDSTAWHANYDSANWKQRGDPQGEQASQATVAYRHGQRDTVNIAFWDHHVESRKKQTMWRDDPAAPLKDSVWEYSR
jgi:prepilin-type processing-associated H-X9-DG protein